MKASENTSEFTIGVGADLYTHFSDGTVRRFHRGDEFGPWRSEFIRHAHVRFRNLPPGVAVAKLCAAYKASHDGLDPFKRPETKANLHARDPWVEKRCREFTR